MASWVAQEGWHALLVALPLHHCAPASHPLAGTSEHPTAAVWPGSHLSQHPAPTMTAGAISEPDPCLPAAPSEAAAFPLQTIRYLDRGGNNPEPPCLLVGPCRVVAFHGAKMPRPDQEGRCRPSLHVAPFPAVFLCPMMDQTAPLISTTAGFAGHLLVMSRPRTCWQRMLTGTSGRSPLQDSRVLTAALPHDQKLRYCRSTGDRRLVPNNQKISSFPHRN